jgi:hypothetical protein
MFCLTVEDHLRLSFGLLVRNYTVHAQAAERLASLVLKARIAVLMLIAAATAAMVVSLYQPGRAYQIVAAIFGGAALVGHSISIVMGLETRVYAHRSQAHRLWLACERYRALLTEIQEGLVDHATMLRRRDILSQEVHAIYDQAFPIDQPAFEHARQAPLEPETSPGGERVIQPQPATQGRS